MKPAIALLAYTRANYFELTLTSILNQRIDGKRVDDYYDIYVFQDGLAEGALAEDVRSYLKIESIVQGMEGRLRFFRQERNLGIGLHFDFIEKYLFLEKGYKYVGFFEDDLILAPGYMKIFKMLQEKFQNDSRVGLISAAPASFQRPLNEQLDNLGGYDHMGHSWAFGISREFWLKRQPFVEEYLNFIKDIRYADRPVSAIKEWLLSKDIRPASTSQDYVKQSATVKLGAICLSTYANYGLYIGRIGTHWNPELYEKMGFQRSVVCHKQFDSASDLTNQRFHELRCEQRFSFVHDPVAGEDVKAAYRLLLGRDAETQQVVDVKSRQTRMQLIEDFLTSKEFVSSPVARRIIKKAASMVEVLENKTAV